MTRKCELYSHYIPRQQLKTLHVSQATCNQQLTIVPIRQAPPGAPLVHPGLAPPFRAPISRSLPPLSRRSKLLIGQALRQAREEKHFPLMRGKPSRARSHQAKAAKSQPGVTRAAHSGLRASNNSGKVVKAFSTSLRVSWVRYLVAGPRPSCPLAADLNFCRWAQWLPRVASLASWMRASYAAL